MHMKIRMQQPMYQCSETAFVKLTFTLVPIRTSLELHNLLSFQYLRLNLEVMAYL